MSSSFLTTNDPSTLIELLRHRAQQQPDQVAYSFFVDSENRVESLTYQELDRKAQAIAALLQSKVAPNERALLLYPPSLEYISAFFGCLYAGVIAVPAYPPHSKKPSPRIQAVVNDSRATVALTTEKILGDLSPRLHITPDLEALHWLATDQLDVSIASAWSAPSVTRDTLAFLQYTSGSTSTPKGVMLTHHNLLHNLKLIATGFKQTPEDRGVIWLPPYHDMGLIGGVLTPMYVGYPVTLLAPIDFLQKPFRWLQLISETKATTSGGPNFAYEMCVNKITEEQRATLDLSSWRVAFNGAEPVRKETLDRFAEYFGPAGFQEEAFFPCYGLAEATLFVTGKSGTHALASNFDAVQLEQNEAIAPQEGEATRELMSSGQIVLQDEQVLRVVDPATFTVLPEGRVGEIWSKSDSIAQGYWNRPEQSKETFGAYTADTNEGPFLRTGDLGFVTEGELYVTGRLKDLIILRGRNYYPQDIEFTMENNAHPAIRSGCTAAFALEIDGEEQMIVVGEIERHFRKNLDVQEVTAAVRQAILEEHGINVYDVVLIKTTTIPKTSSGKIQRHACRNQYVEGSFDLIGSAKAEAGSKQADAKLPLLPDGVTSETLRAVTRTEQREIVGQYLLRLVAQKLQIDVARLSLSHPVDSLGVASLMAVEFSNQIENDLDVIVPMETFLQEISLEQLADQIVGLLQEGAHAVIPATALSADGTAALSYGQASMWFMDKMNPNNPVYNLTFATEIHSALDVTAVERAFQAILDRHPMLRATFVEQNGQPLQKINEGAKVHFLHEQVAALSQEGLTQRLSELAYAPFDLENGPLFRVNLLTRSESEHVLLLVIHHIVSDFWALVVLMDEFKDLYQAALKGQHAELPAVQMQYVDFAGWQNAYLAGERGDKLASYWTQKLENAPQTLSLPTDRPRPPVQTTRGDSYRFRLDERLTKKLKALAKAEGTTLYTALLSAFQILLSRYSGQDDLLIGSPMLNRRMAKLEHVVGYFANAVVLRGDLSGNPTYADFLKQMRKTVLEALEHQDYPFPLLIEKMNVTRDLSHSPLFQVWFVLQNSQRDQAYSRYALGEAGGKLDLGGLQLESLSLEEKVSEFDLTLAMAEEHETLLASFQYNTDLFDLSTITQMAGNLEVLIEEMCANPERHVSELNILTEAEREQLLVAWNDTFVDVPSDVCVHQLFEARAAAQPDATAVVFEDQSLTYGELNERANHLAHYLQKQGVGRGTLVGICMERSLPMIVGLMGILKAGAAYVPIDPQYPQDRIAYIIEDSAAKVLLTQASLVSELPSHQASVIQIDTDWADIALEKADNPATGVNADDLAYVIYTSGSTGKPKGVLVPHGGVVNFFAGMDERVGCDSEDTLLAVTSISFDISVLELFWTLARGAKVVLISEQGATGPLGEAAEDKTGNGMAFSLFYFASDESENEDKYRLLLEGAKYADQNGFTAVWTPERHFHKFGGLYPSPSVMASALSMITDRIQLRAGSVVLPLHHPVRVAEEWSVVDQLSKGRVGLSIASGWHADDFLLAPDNYKNRNQLMFDNIEIVKSLWRGEAVTFKGGAGNDVSVRTLPRPVQAELPVWVTSGGNKDTFIKAGETGANLLTHLLGQSVEDLAEKIALYREALAKNGFDPSTRTVSLMLHTFVGEDLEAVRARVEKPFKQYLMSSIGLIENLARSLKLGNSISEMSQEDLDALLTYAFDRYFGTSALFGTPETCLDMVARLREIGVDECACLIDFGVDEQAVLDSLDRLNDLRALCEPKQQVLDESVASFSLPEQAIRHQATLLQCTPSLMQIQLSGQGVTQALHSLRAIMLGGEALPASLAAQIKKALPARLVNMYGPTETTIWSTTHEVTDVGTQIPIGKPIANTDIYILDAALQPVPLGVVGDLYIGGRGVTHGYLHRPDLTEERFLPNPFAQEKGRIYKTGDLARYAKDGTIEYMGRSDFQVKIRGFRIELGEIEAALEQQTSVAKAVVDARELKAGDKRLVAYLVPATGMTISTKELRDALKEQLPEYMVPQFFVKLDTLPLTPNGKVDRKRLPLPDMSTVSDDTVFVAPRTAVEQKLAGIWSELLKVDKVSVHHNFFELGGHSLLATQAVSRINAEFGTTVSLRQFFEIASLESLAGQLDGKLESGLTSKLPPITSALRDQDLPLSFAQERIWFFEQWEPGTHIYNEATRLIRMKGVLDTFALERAFNEIVARHEVLRTTFGTKNGAPFQVIRESLTLDLPIVDLSEMSADDREHLIDDLAKKEVKRPFDLIEDPLVRITLVRLGTEDHILMLTMHHIVADGWALGVFIHELTSMYEAFVAGNPSPLAPLPIQYADYAKWQRDRMAEGAYDEQIAYWKQQLGGEIAVLQLPTDRPRPPVQTYNGASARFTLSPQLSERLNALSQEAGVTMYITLLSALKTMLSRYTGHKDIAVGTLIANRNHSEIENLMGVFINTLVMRTDLSGNPTFRELLERTKDVAFAAYANQDVPFEKLVEELHVERNMSYTPLFQVMFIYQNTPQAGLHMPGLELSYDSVDPETAKFDLTLVMEETSEGVQATFDYNCDLFGAERMARMTEHFVKLLEAFTQDATRKIEGVDLLGDDERQKVLIDWNQTAADYPADQCLHHLFEEQVLRTPNNVAAIYGENTLTYAELNAEANRLAHYLRTLGVGPDVPVGISVERSLELVVAILAILKAGGAYLPIDTEAPDERKHQLLADAVAPVCLTQTNFVSTVQAEGVTVIDLNADASKWADQPATSPQVDLTPDNLVSLYYTSGSTGKPKGVMNLHRGWVNRMVWMQREHKLEAHETVLQKTTLTFDDSAVEFFWPLLVGARIALLEPVLHKDPWAILEAAIRYQVAVIQFVPSVLVPFLEAVTPEKREQLQGLRHMISSGETLRSEVVRTFFEKLPHAKLHNQWGPTEVSIDTTLHTCTEADTVEGVIVPIGVPLMNHSVYILDDRHNPVPIGVVGELYIAGNGLARGYLNNPEKTEEAFLANPFLPGEMMYKTGDRGFFREDGSILFLGRLDGQVKIRGMRVELGEIEAVLGEVEALNDVVVLAREVAQGDKRLFAYVVPRAGHAVTTAELREFMKEKLPEYMVPSAFTILDEMPLTPNGKADRKALPTPELDRSDMSQAEYVAPRNAIEEKIAEIFSEILKIERIGIHDHFFELGGHSLLATQAVTRLREIYMVDLSLRAMFESPTVAAVAELLNQQIAELQGDEDLSDLLSELDDLTDEEIEAMLAEEN